MAEKVIAHPVPDDPNAIATHLRDDFDDIHNRAPTAVKAKWLGSDSDKKDMVQLGRIQELRRNFHFLSILGFACTLIATWEVLLTTFGQVLTNGGTAGLIWGFVIVVVGFSFVYLSIAELASAAPTAGGQYHWVSEFAPPFCQKFLSYVVGWLCFTGWQGAICSLAFLTGTIIQGLIVLNYPDTYVYERWHGTLLVIAVTSFSIIFNTILAKRLPLVEGLLLILHVLGLFAIIITLWVMAPTADSRDVWTVFNNGGGWDSNGTATLIGILSPLISMLGFDCAVHLSEEIHSSSSTLPKALLGAVYFNAALGFLMAVTLAYTLGDVDSLINSTTGFPFIQLFFNVTKSYAGTNVLTAVVILTLTSATIAEVATASRQLWSFARDRGLPGYSWLSRITPGWNIPLNAVLVSLLVTSLLSLINIGSTTALNAILALTSVSLLSSYMIVIGCVIVRRVKGGDLPFRQFSLGRWGLVINIISMCYLAPIFVFSFFPPFTPADPTTMNWAVVMFFGIMLFAIVYYFALGRRHYIPPVRLVKRDGFEY